ncbi:hypothetical protein [Thalassoglobus polymorphus]|uniref:Uncharacterized protein n=1 Tax=Thalassoglobus polymorphus TaxID=2527994 RepID=A0A517QM83_9PLAN|nr:hypothetical protein [Thalassoglobus polymorphus]QDT32744.1 hypothetical protein Mal48_19910 [Thalassoglobus polymorphus]
MTFGVIELLLLSFLLLVVPGVLGGAALTGTSKQSCSRVDWSKVFFVFLGIPFLLIAAVVGLFFVRNSQVQHAHVEQSRLEAKQNLAVVADQIRASESKALHQDEDSEHHDPNSHSEQHEHAGGHTSYNSHGMTDFSPRHDTEVVYDNFTKATEKHSSWAMTFTLGVIGLLVLGSLVWFGRKRPVLTVCCFLGIAAVGLLGGYSATEVSPSQHVTHADAELRELIDAEDVSTAADDLIPVNEENEQGNEEGPLAIREITHRYQGTTGTRSQTLSEIPAWVEEANGQNLVRPKQGEIVLVSKRYSSLDEAKLELKPIANSLIQSELARTYPEMRGTTFSVESFLSSKILEQECEIIWPFKVREFTGEMKQLAWKLDISESTKRKLYAHWQNGARQDRLAILGTGLGLLTLFFGAGAIVARRRDSNRVS